MKKKTAPTKRAHTVKTKAGDLAALLTEVRNLIQSARRGVAAVVDRFQVMTNFEIGRRIVEHEQKGAKRAEYGAEVIIELSARLTEEFGRGFSVTNLKLMRQFFMERRDRIGQSMTDQLKLSAPTSQSPTDQSTMIQAVTEKSSLLLSRLSWTHYVELLGIKDPDERGFFVHFPRTIVH
jgi:hypothetical protein